MRCNFLDLYLYRQSDSFRRKKLFLNLLRKDQPFDWYLHFKFSLCLRLRLVAKFSISLLILLFYLFLSLGFIQTQFIYDQNTVNATQIDIIMDILRDKFTDYNMIFVKKKEVKGYSPKSSTYLGSPQSALQIKHIKRLEHDAPKLDILKLCSLEIWTFLRD